MNGVPTDIQWYVRNLKSSVLRLVSAKCTFHPIYIKGLPSLLWRETMGHFEMAANYSSHCTMGRIDTLGAAFHCTTCILPMERNRLRLHQFISICYALYLWFIPSNSTMNQEHQCLQGECTTLRGWAWASSELQHWTMKHLYSHCTGTNINFQWS